MNNETLIPIDRQLAVSPSQILMLKADINYTHILLQDGSYVTSSRTLGIFERRLSDETFFRLNRSIIINLHYMVDFQREAATIRLGNDESIIISRRRVKGFLKNLRVSAKSFYGEIYQGEFAL